LAAPPAALELVPVAAGTRLRLRVKAGARRAAILGVHGGALKLAVTAPAERGKANAAVLALLAARLDLAPCSIEMLSGHSAPDKVVLVPLPPEALARRLAVA
jgi:hypothetical protein